MPKEISDAIIEIVKAGGDEAWRFYLLWIAVQVAKTIIGISAACAIVAVTIRFGLRLAALPEDVKKSNDGAIFGLCMALMLVVLVALAIVACSV